MSGFPGSVDLVRNFTPIDLRPRRVATSGSVFVPRIRAIIWLRFAGENMSTILAPPLAQVLNRTTLDYPIASKFFCRQLVVADEKPRILDGEAELL